ncbi:hypothetical protein T4B_2685 [Trichinella pseudospiralis]|uniref:Uncharacterized protein n=1 Tax=Trichinella pseudospiralis TaxID=6337 RepID=A0A0V1K756_TRIPS|nr:hypothetical protein T4A_11021 [Trichinella pseudospiralis]KRZ31508.1 hypothetical protein T4B_2685 [Trichinella pseudospiralis]KRZ43079.1 hypothetical protein T4C_8124 [Trichinella pseudospiralis]
MSSRISCCVSSVNGKITELRIFYKIMSDVEFTIYFKFHLTFSCSATFTPLIFRITGSSAIAYGQGYKDVYTSLLRQSVSIVIQLSSKGHCRRVKCTENNVIKLR